MNKRGISPIVATILLVVIAIIIALIIILWAKNIVKESIQKSVAGKSEKIENFCKEVSFSADVSLKNTGSSRESHELNFGITNSGNVPIYQIQVLKVDRDKGAKSDVGKLIIQPSSSLKSGESFNGNADLTVELTEGDKVLLVPILLGEVGEQKTWHICDEQFGTEEEIGI